MHTERERELVLYSLHPADTNKGVRPARSIHISNIHPSLNTQTGGNEPKDAGVRTSTRL